MSQSTTTPTDPSTDAPPLETGRLARLKRSTAFESFQYRDFRWVWFGSFGSFMAMNMQMITRSWLVLRLTDDSPLDLALVMMTFSIPMTFVSLIGGALADRFSRRQMVILSQSGNVIMTLVVGIMDFTGLITFEYLLLFGLVNGSLAAFNMPSRMAIISDIVPEKGLMNAISLSNSGMNVTRIAGPALAGLLIIFIDTAGVFFLISGIYLLSVFTMLAVKAGTTPAKRSPNGIFADIKEGLSYAISDPTRRGLVIMAFIPVLFGMSYFALLPAWAREALDVEADGLGVLMMIMGIGALVGTLMLASMTNMKRRGAFLLVNCVVWGVALSIFALSPSYLFAVPFLLLLGLTSSIFMSLNMTLLQTNSSPEMRGRIMSINMMTFGVMPLSAIPFGVLAERTGTPDALFISGLLLIAFTLLFTVAYPHYRRIR